MLATSRLLNDFKELVRDPPLNFRAAFEPCNKLLWHFIFVGNKDTPFEGGYYYGQIKFDADFPFKPPSYKMCTPSGRFTINQKICISNSSYHKENWNPLWTAGALINGFIQLFHDITQKHFIGACLNQSNEMYKKNAGQSTLKLLGLLEKKSEIKELFSDIVVQIRSELNGAKPSNRLPFSAEHLEWKKQQALKKVHCNKDFDSDY
ncbi:(wild Malaysian banana) hypothetical protein [Aphelenchoides besseyi]|nr:(wild Malaysian banana) hypothetical protein [Aphelenchoides besseyi]